MEARNGPQKPHLPPPSLWPVGFAVGIACLLVGLVVSWPAVAVGAGIAIVFGFLWVRDVTAPYRRAAEVEPERREPARPVTPREGTEPERFPRNVFLESATLGLGAVIGGIATVPAIGFAVAPSFIGQRSKEVDLGLIENFPAGQFVIANFLSKPGEGEVSRRTAYIRYNGLLEGKPSFTIISNRCVHLGCPVQPNGPKLQPKKVGPAKFQVTLTPTQPAGFGCPCHGGAYDIEGNRTAGPPVRALDRYEFSIRNGRLILGRLYSVGKVEGEGKSARIEQFDYAGPGEHIDDWETFLYPGQAPH